MSVSASNSVMAIAASLTVLCRAVEDYVVVYIGSAVFKILRLLTVATFCVHLFACMFFRVKVMSAATDESVADFYTTRGIEIDVSSPIFFQRTQIFLLSLSACRTL